MLSAVGLRSGNVTTRGARNLVEPLEGRTLLHTPTVVSVIADSRGDVLVNLDKGSGEEVDPATINKASAILYTAGTDKKFGTSDDVRLRENVSWNPAASRITLRAKIKHGTGYRVR